MAILVKLVLRGADDLVLALVPFFWFLLDARSEERVEVVRRELVTTARERERICWFLLCNVPADAFGISRLDEVEHRILGPELAHAPNEGQRGPKDPSDELLWLDNGLAPLSVGDATIAVVHVELKQRKRVNGAPLASVRADEGFARDMRAVLHLSS